VKGKEANGVGSQQSCTVSEHSLSSITTADAHNPADINGLVRFAGRPNLVSARVPSHSVFPLSTRIHADSV